jgi:hypothetical protein
MVLHGILREETNMIDLPDYIVESPFDLIEAEGIDEVHRIMAPCRNCGELRPRDDFSMGINGICHLCRVSPEIRERDTTKILALWEQLDEAALDDDDEGDADEHDEKEE